MSLSYLTHIVYLYPIVLRGIPPPHWWSGGSGNPDEDKEAGNVVD